QRAKATDTVSCFTPVEVDRRDVLTDGAAVVETEAGIDCHSLSDRHGVGHKQGRGNELAAIVRWITGDALKGLPVVVDVPDARRNAYRLTVLAFFDFCAHFPRVTGAKEFALIVGERRLSCRTNERQPADLCWSAAADVGSTVNPTCRREITGTWIV